MNLTVQQRICLFLFGCILTRIVFFVLAKYSSILTQNVLGYIAFIIATGFIIIYMFGLRKTGFETGGEAIWWNNLRPIHSVLYYLFFWNIFYGNRTEAWQILLVDVLVGLGSFVFYHFL